MSQPQNVALVLTGPQTLELKEREIVQPGFGEVLVQIHHVGICGSDVHYWKHGRIGNFVVEEPLVLGHESSGVIVKVGPGVKHLKEGDRVALEPGVPCYKCQYCKNGRYNLCADVRFLATPPIDGDLSNYHIHDAHFCFKLPDNVSLEEGALVEPLSVAVHACRRGHVTLGSSVLICGAGPIGLVNLLVALAMGAGRVVITDILPHRLEMAKSLGACETVLLDPRESVDEVADRVRTMFWDSCDGANTVIECSGTESGVSLAMKTCRSGGTLVLVGVGPSSYMNVPLLEVCMREIEVKGVFRYCNCYPAAIAMLAKGRVDVKSLITHRFSLEEGVQAFETASDPRSQSVKVMISCAPNLPDESF